VNSCKIIRLLKPFEIKGNYQFFHKWFAESWERNNFNLHDNFSINWKIRLILAKLKITRSFGSNNKNALLVLSAGLPDSFIFPFCYKYEIVPIIWDCWPRYWDRLVNSFKRNKIRVAFFTSSQVAEIMKYKCPSTTCYWLPEGIQSEMYMKGEELCNRNIDLLELGRIMQKYHDIIINSKPHNLRRQLYSNPSQSLIFKDQKSLVHGLSDTKISICFPRCDTHPEMAGEIETLTQRYWECMLSRTIMLGRAPGELVNFIGYNPVIDVDWNDPIRQLTFILNNINNYQRLVDRNFAIAQQLASWDFRIQDLKNLLYKEGYSCYF
jgi:hypothetical protein